MHCKLLCVVTVFLNKCMMIKLISEKKNFCGIYIPWSGIKMISGTGSFLTVFSSTSVDSIADANIRIELKTVL